MKQDVHEIEIRETHIVRTIEAAKKSFFAEEQKATLSYRSFLYVQFQLIQKRWWLFQILLLVAFGILLPQLDTMLYIRRSMGVIASLFVILVVPELWKNRSSCSMEIEGATYYSLRQIYAARLLLFGSMDVWILTIFGGIVTISLQISIAELLIQFLFPMVVTAGICFCVLCNKHLLGESVVIGLCVLWSAVWWFLLLDEAVYEAINLPLWILLFGIAVVIVGFLVHRTVSTCERIWEVNEIGIGIE